MRAGSRRSAPRLGKLDPQHALLHPTLRVEGGETGTHEEPLEEREQRLARVRVEVRVPLEGRARDPEGLVKGHVADLDLLPAAGPAPGAVGPSGRSVSVGASAGPEILTCVPCSPVAVEAREPDVETVLPAGEAPRPPLDACEPRGGCRLFPCSRLPARHRRPQRAAQDGRHR